MLVWLKRMAAFAAVALVTACGGGDDDPAPPPAPVGNVVQVAQGNADFSILVEAVTAADLGATLSGPGPFTVFAPTNAAFAALLTELGVTKAQLLADKALLTAVLTYHVLPSRVFKAGIPLGEHITTVQGGFFKIEEAGSAVLITDARNRTSNIVTTDIRANNGIVHAIDKVLLPGNKNIVQTASALPDFSILVEAVVAANLGGTLSGPGPFTVFAPTDEAFAKVPKAQLDALLADKAKLTAVLTYHVVAGKVMAKDVKAGKVKTVQGSELTLGTTGGVTVDNAKVVAADIVADNGVIHVIDTVVIPK